MARKVIKDLAESLRSDLLNYDGGPGTFPDLLYRILATLPGGDEAEDMGFQPIEGMGWHEAQMLEEMLSTIQDKTDVEELVNLLLRHDEDEEELEEAPRRRHRSGARSGHRVHLRRR